VSDLTLVVYVGGLGGSQLKDLELALSLRLAGQIEPLWTGDKDGWKQDVRGKIIARLSDTTKPPVAHVVVIGHSLGGPTALYAADRLTDWQSGYKVPLVVLLDPVKWFGDRAATQPANMGRVIIYRPAVEWFPPQTVTGADVTNTIVPDVDHNTLCHGPLVPDEVTAAILET